ncbi:virginiamycin B lyase family protein [Streptomyces sp. NPDC055815]
MGRIAPDSQITEFPLPDRTARPHSVTVDDDCTAWFTEWAGNRIGTITLAGEGQSPCPGAGTAVGGAKGSRPPLGWTRIGHGGPDQGFG